jgi:hypothetical protein
VLVLMLVLVLVSRLPVLFVLRGMGRRVPVMVRARVHTETLPCCGQQEKNRPDQGDRTLRKASVHGMLGKRGRQAAISLPRPTWALRTYIVPGRRQRL